MRVVITGAAGFLASHLTDRFLANGDAVVGIDNFLTGRPANLAHLSGNAKFEFIEHDVSTAYDVEGPVDGVLHVVEGVGGQWYGARSNDAESRQDEIYLKELTERLRAQVAGTPIRQVSMVLGFGDVKRELARLSEVAGLDLLIVGGHGHRGLSDIMHGETISGVRHRLDIPILAIKQSRRSR